MPIFEYECGSCGRTFEKLVMTTVASKRGVVCAHCGDKRVTRRFSTFSARNGGTGRAGGGRAGGSGPGPAAGGCGSGSCGCR